MDRKGFTPIIALIVLAVVVVGFVGYSLLGKSSEAGAGNKNALADFLSVVWPFGGSTQQAPATAGVLHLTAHDLTNHLLRMASSYQQANASDKAAALAAVTGIVNQRKQFLLSEIDNNPSQALLDLLPQSALDQLPSDVSAMLEQHVTASGELTVRHVDEFKQGQSQFIYTVADQTSGKQYELHFAKGQTHLATGATVKVDGTAVDGQLLLAQAGGSNFQTVTAASGAVDTGVQKTLVMLVNFSDNASQPFTPADVNGVMFTNPDSVNTYYQEDSFGLTSFSGSVVTQWLTVPYTGATTCNSPGTISAAADSQAAAAGYTLSNYTRKIYMFPWEGCSFGGMATIGGSPSLAWIQDQGLGYDQETLEHELGHNLGQFHASTWTCGAKQIDSYANCGWSEYGEAYDPLGYYNSNNSNAAHKYDFGWASGSNIQTVSSNGTYTIAPIETKTTAPQVLVIAKPDTGESYYLGYRQPVGRDASLPAGITSGALVYVASPNYNTAWLDMTPGDGDFSNAGLTDGNSFQDPANGLAVTQLSHSASSVVVQVTFTPPPCVTATPTIVMTPVSQTGKDGQGLQYAVSVKDIDSASCAGGTFNLSDAVPAGFSATLSAQTLSLAPGASANATMTVTPDNTVIDGSYLLTAQITRASNTADTGTSQTTYVVYTPVPDVTPPTASITSPANGSKISGSQVTVSVSASDNIGVAKVEIYIDGKLAATDTSSPYTYRWNIKKVASGSHTIMAKAYDAAGNVGTASVTVTK